MADLNQLSDTDALILEGSHAHPTRARAEHLCNYAMNVDGDDLRVRFHFPSERNTPSLYIHASRLRAASGPLRAFVDKSFSEGASRMVTMQEEEYSVFDSIRKYLYGVPFEVGSESVSLARAADRLLLPGILDAFLRRQSCACSGVWELCNKLIPVLQNTRAPLEFLTEFSYKFAYDILEFAESESGLQLWDEDENNFHTSTQRPLSQMGVWCFFLDQRILLDVTKRVLDWAELDLVNELFELMINGLLPRVHDCKEKIEMVHSAILCLLFTGAVDREVFHKSKLPGPLQSKLLEYFMHGCAAVPMRRASKHKEIVEGSNNKFSFQFDIPFQCSLEFLVQTHLAFDSNPRSVQISLKGFEFTPGEVDLRVKVCILRVPCKCENMSGVPFVMELCGSGNLLPCGCMTGVYTGSQMFTFKDQRDDDMKGLFMHGLHTDCKLVLRVEVLNFSKADASKKVVDTFNLAHL